AFWCILPYVEQENAYRLRDYGVGVKIFLCPSRGRQQPQAAPLPVDPTYNGAYGWEIHLNPEGHPNLWCKTDYAMNRNVSPTSISGGVPGPPVGINHIADGTTNTLLSGEKAMDIALYNTGTWWYDEPALSGGTGGTSRPGTGLFPDVILAPEEHTGREYFTQGRGAWGSRHPGVVQFVLCAGSVRGIPFSTPADVMRRLLDHKDGEVVDLPGN